jgi:two-component system cell cycle sensor histidine kinase/response regulator CckA
MTADAILRCAGNGILALDANGRVTFANPAASAMLGRSAEALSAATDACPLLHPVRVDGTRCSPPECPIEQTLRDGKTRVVDDEVFARGDDSRFTVAYECAALADGDTTAGAVITFRDVTEKQSLERQRALAVRVETLGRAAATIAHEFNNVLMGVEPFAEIIRRRANGDERLRMPADQISNSVRRGRRVTEAILHFTKPAEPAMRVVDAGEWLRSLEPALRAFAGSIDVALVLPLEPVYVSCDPAQMEQVVTNLLTNARDAMPNGGRVTVELSAESDAMQLLVRDRGTGIPPHVVPQMFDPLFTTKRSATGLGLAIARHVVLRHGGSIAAANEPDGGACITIALPLADAPTHDSGFAASATEVHDVLLVEDESDVALGLSALLDQERIAVRIAGRASVVAAMIEVKAPDVVVLDLTLPDADGATLFRNLRERWPRLPVVFSTGHGGENELAGELQQPRVAFLRKPYGIADLLTAMKRVTS